MQTDLAHRIAQRVMDWLKTSDYALLAEDDRISIAAEVQAELARDIVLLNAHTRLNTLPGRLARRNAEALLKLRTGTS